MSATIASVEKLVEKSKAHFWQPPDLPCCCCVLELPSGFTVVGRSPPVEKEAYSPEMGQRLAFDEAVNELVKLEAYRLGTMGPRIEVAPAGVLTGLRAHG